MRQASRGKGKDFDTDRSRLRMRSLDPMWTKMVEARGVEPLSEDRQHTASTCVADNLISQPSTPVGRLRTAASPEQSRPQPLGTSLGPARCIAPFHPRGPQMEERHSLIKLRVPVLDWQLHFPGVDESPRARHATVVSVSPSKPVAPFLENVQRASDCPLTCSETRSPHLRWS